MRDTLNQLLATPLDVSWKVLTALTIFSMLEMTRNLFRRVGHIQP